MTPSKALIHAAAAVVSLSMPQTLPPSALSRLPTLCPVQAVNNGVLMLAAPPVHYFSCQIVLQCF